MVKKVLLVKKAKEMLELEFDAWSKNELAFRYNSDLIQTDGLDPAQKTEAEKQVKAAKHNCEETLKRISWIENFIKSAK